MTLIEAIQIIDIQLVPGRVYNFEADGCHVELRVRPGPPAPAKPMDLEPDTMYDAWVEFPLPKGEPVQFVTSIHPPRPDIPYIPRDDDES